ncbi:glycosyltransferase family 4 protein [Kiloniella majae]|uniref:glycosyltransferase family 4 protein n=1 Tax=Kiloniella majae TaxID=1938558 RepID=UPI000A278963|nr:glycosyltransferase family 4 protein [Kiloniella majae]
MKILYVARLYSGLENSINELNWEPRGVPTVAKLIERLSKDESINLRIIFSVKDGYTTLSLTNDKKIKISGINADISILSGYVFGHLPKTKIHKMIREISHTYKIFRLILIEKPNVIYFDHGSIWTAGLISRVLSIPTIFRVMGISPAMRRSQVQVNFVNRILKWLYKAPFSAVISTEDGSGSKLWCKNSLNHKATCHIWLNGVNHISSPPIITETHPEKFSVLFVGRLDPDKGGKEFLEALILCKNKFNKNIRGVIIGDGIEMQLMQKLSQKHQLDIDFQGLIPHAKIMDMHKQTHCYVSLNQFGNLSNANLEAMASGQCMIVPQPKPYNEIDAITDSLFGQALCYVPSPTNTDALARVISDLEENPNKIIYKKRCMYHLARKYIPTWEERIDKEMALIKDIAS